MSDPFAQPETEPTAALLAPADGKVRAELQTLFLGLRMTEEYA